VDAKAHVHGRSLAGGTARELGHDVEMAQMRGVLLHEVEHHPLQGCRWLTIPSPRAGFAGAQQVDQGGTLERREL
jgi:hypothetical protein